MKRIILYTFCLLASITGFAQIEGKSPRWWDASWISVPGAVPNSYGVYYFRKTINLENVPETFPISVSGDTRYKLYVNGEIVSIGPARSDVTHWRYETVDISDNLKTGDNVVAAVVWHEGAFKPEANNSSMYSAFILQGGNEAASILNTDGSWKCIKDEAYQPIPVLMPTFYAAGPGEKLDMNKTVANWNTSECDDSQWMPAQTLIRGLLHDKPEKIGEGGGLWGLELVPDPLPQMELTYQRLQTVRAAEGCSVPATFASQKQSITIPANTKAKIILDQTYLTNAYFSLEFSKGKNSTITPIYLESYYTEYPNKGNRDEIEGKTLTAKIDEATRFRTRIQFRYEIEGDEMYLARADCITSNGEDNQKFTTLYWRTYRYVQLDIETKDEALTIDDVYGTFTGFPFELKASLDTDNEELQKIFEIGWRTARLCAVETFTDCPYYEQLQYFGDSRIQAILSLYMTGDDRLIRNLIYMGDISRRPEGITMCRYPETTLVVITPFSLWYIGSIYDYLMYANDADFVKSKLPGMRSIIDYFSRYQQEDGSLVDLPGWNFTDWLDVEGWTSGVAERGADGRSALMDLQLLNGLLYASKLEYAVGIKELGDYYKKEADKLGETINRLYWDESKGLYANRSEHDLYCQHANALAILTGLVEGDAAKAVAEKIINDESVAKASIYFRYYINHALVKAGCGDNYLDWLDIWRQNIAYGLTTWAETSDIDAARSDCHAWGASPSIEFFRTILGIDTAAPCFQKVKIEPHLGKITKIGGTMPHPNGSITVSYEISKKGKLNAVVTLPDGISGTFVWDGIETALQGGRNELEL